MLELLAESGSKAARGRTVKELGVVLRPAGRGLLAEKLILAGLEVVEVLPDGPEVGLERGDLILNYGSVYDLVMGAGDGDRAMRALLNRLKYASDRSPRILRGRRVPTVPLPGR